MYGPQAKWDKEEEIFREAFAHEVQGSILIPEELKSHLVDSASRMSYLLCNRAYFDDNKTAYITGKVGGNPFVIRNDNLKLVEALSATALAVASYAAVVSASIEVMAVSLIVAVIALADRLRKKSANLDNEQYRLLLILKACGPIRAEDLAVRLSELHIYGRSVWTEEKTTAALKVLESVHLRDGSTEALVAQSSDGTWAVNGL